MNAMAAALACSRLGYSAHAIRRGLASFKGVRGRFEVVARAPLVVVDYAHSPDGLEQTLKTASKLVGEGGQVVCVFGCGGQRDKAKRPAMGCIADELAERVILTSDNPRFEDPEAIASDVRAGAAGQALWTTLLDRPGAIRLALAEAGPPDVVVIAGKGHETVQEVRGETIEMSDQAIARAAASIS
jgi:UDP-N-acetylmuramoyl-L-alanyl-D-glutamate--2,6-diaminopimelate ligase